MRDRELLEMSAIVSGRVQGVGFRATTKYLAEDLKLTGFVRNLSDGSVEICAQGSMSHLEKLLADLRREFSSDYIQNIAVDIHPIQKSYADFKIVR